MVEDHIGDFFQAAPDAMALVGPDRRVRYANPAFRAVSGPDPDGVDVMDLVAPAAWDRIRRELARAAGGEPVFVEVPHPQDDGEDLVVEYRFFPLEGGTVGMVGRVGAPESALQAELDRTRAKLRRLTQRLDGIETELTQVPFMDPVTGLWNRLRVIERLAVEWNRMERWKSPLGCLVVGVEADGRRIEDLRLREGDGTADALLRAAAQRLRGVVRDHDIAGRHEGEALVVVSVHCDAEGAGILGHRIVECVRQEPAVVDGRSFALRVRIGASISRSEGVQMLEDLLEVAARALDEARRRGRDFLCL